MITTDTAQDVQVRDLRDALLMDFDALARSERQSSQMFVLAMRYHIPDPPEDWSGSDVLADATYGLSKEFNGNVVEARRIYRRISGANYDEALSEYSRILGQTLLAWTTPRTVKSTLRSAAECVSECGDALVRTVSYARLRILAENVGYLDFALEMARRAAESTPPRRRLLHWRLLNAEANARGRHRFVRPPRGTDALAERRAVVDLALESGQKTLSEAATSNTANPWARGFSFGLTTTDNLMAAHMQAEWAGASWLIPSIRKQVASTILLAGGRSPYEHALAAAYWCLSSNDRIGEVLDHLEKHFDDSSFQSFWHDHLRRGERVRDKNTLMQVLAAYWDLMEPRDGARVLAELTRQARHASPSDHVVGVIAALGLVTEAQWASMVSRLSDETLERTLKAMSPGYFRYLSADSVDLLTDVIKRGAGDRVRLSLLLAMSERSPDAELDAIVKDVSKEAPAEDIALAARNYPQFVGPRELDRAVESLLDRVSAGVEAARAGTIAFGGVSAPQRLGIAIASIADNAAGQSAAAQLVQWSADRGVVREYREELLLGLRYVAYAKPALIDRDRLAPARSDSTTLEPPFSFPERFDESLATIIAAFLEGPGGSVTLLAHARSADPRVREVAVEALGELALSGARSPLVEAAIIGSLFDAERTVLRSGLAVVARSNFEAPGLRDLAIDRIASLFGTARRDVRMSCCAAAMELQKVAADSRLSALLDEATSDRSWRVRASAG